ncbi:transposase [Candidatus Uhrbacteria bacterium]|nr:transposase [Candidatus Uhrbacteria bacterium]
MARPLRIELRGGLFHVTSRGNRKKRIYEDDSDRELFLWNLNDVLKTHNWICHAYCLMNNHYHLLIQTPDANLSAGMRDLNGEYTQMYNRIHHTVGHVFQGRFKAFIIEKEPYFLEVARYIVLNPVRSRSVRHPSHWKWSSYEGTAFSRRPNRLLFADDLLHSFSKDKRKARILYRAFIDEGIGGPSPFNRAAHRLILGSPQFISAMWEIAQDAEEKWEIPKTERMISRPSLPDLFDDVSTQDERDLNIRLARERAGYSLSEIARHLHLHRSTIGKIFRAK